MASSAKPCLHDWRWSTGSPVTGSFGVGVGIGPLGVGRSAGRLGDAPRSWDAPANTKAIAAATPTAATTTVLAARRCARRVRGSASKRYEILVRTHVVPRIGKVRLDRLRPYHLQRLVDEMLGTVAPATAHKCYAVMASSLTQAVRWAADLSLTSDRRRAAMRSPS
jgi:Phage integrase, N-terminal SAM-like domain